MGEPESTMLSHLIHKCVYRFKVTSKESCWSSLYIDVGSGGGRGDTRYTPPLIMPPSPPPTPLTPQSKKSFLHVIQFYKPIFVDHLLTVNFCSFLRHTLNWNNQPSATFCCYTCISSELKQRLMNQVWLSVATTSSYACTWIVVCHSLAYEVQYFQKW